MSIAKLRDEKIFFTGGAVKKGEPASDQVIEYDLLSNVVRQAPKMNKARVDHRSCVLDEKLFVCGGWDKNRG